VHSKAPMEKVLEIVRSADVVLVMNKPAVVRRDNVRLELEEAIKYGIPIVGNDPPAREGATRGSQYLAELGVPIVAWRRDSIVAAIRDQVALAKSRRVRAATPAEEEAFEPLEEAALEAKEHLTPEQLEEVRPDDKIVEAPFMPTQTVLPKDSIFRDGQSDTITVSASPPEPPRSFFSRLFKH
jgi:hypothetical protein